jgi:hypothetical protein
MEGRARGMVPYIGMISACLADGGPKLEGDQPFPGDDSWSWDEAGEAGQDRLAQREDRDGLNAVDRGCFVIGGRRMSSFTPLVPVTC